MPRKHPPMLMRGGLTGRIYVVTRYKDLGEGRFEAIEKWDVTDAFENLKMEEAVASAQLAAENDSSTPKGDDAHGWPTS